MIIQYKIPAFFYFPRFTQLFCVTLNSLLWFCTLFTNIFVNILYNYSFYFFLRHPVKML